MSTDIRAALENLLSRLDQTTDPTDPIPAWADSYRAARVALEAQPRKEGAGALLHPAYEPSDGSADGLKRPCPQPSGAQLIDGEWWHPIMGCDSLQIVVDNARAALAQAGGDFNHIELALPEEWLADAWNAQADVNQWDSLDTSEQLAFAQTRAVAVDRNRRAASLPAPELGEGSTLKEVSEWICKEDPDPGAFGYQHHDVMRIVLAALAHFRRPAAAPVAPEVGPAMADLENIELAFEQNFGCKVRTSRIRPVLLHYATLLQQQAAKIAELETNLNELSEEVKK